jgi:putative resolvase
VKLAEWARSNGVHPQTAYRWFREDKMPVAARRLESGTIWVDTALEGASGRVLYARVSSHDQRADLDRQVARLASWATGHGHQVDEVVIEVLTSMCARLYGRPGARNRAMRAVTAAGHEPGEAP